MSRVRRTALTCSSFAIAAIAALRAASEFTRGAVVRGAAPASPVAESTLPARSRLTMSSPPTTGMPRAQLLEADRGAAGGRAAG